MSREVGVYEDRPSAHSLGYSSVIKTRRIYWDKGLRCAVFVPHGRLFFAPSCAHLRPVGGSINLTTERYIMPCGYLLGLWTGGKSSSPAVSNLVDKSTKDLATNMYELYRKSKG